LQQIAKRLDLLLGTDHELTFCEVRNVLYH
jgi:hypothetical protein